MPEADNRVNIAAHMADIDNTIINPLLLIFLSSLSI